MSFGNLSDLGRLSFSDRVYEALRRLDKKKSKSSPSDDAIQDFITGQIFIYENEIQKLEVIRILIEFFESSSSDGIFRHLFADPAWDPLLHGLLSTSLGLKASPVLCSAGHFLLSLPHDPPRLKEAYKTLLGDFLPNQAGALSPLPSLSHSLTYAILLVLPTQDPPNPLLPILQEWLKDYPSQSLLPPPKTKITPGQLLPPLLSLPLWTLFLENKSDYALDIHLRLLSLLADIQELPEKSSFTLEAKQVNSFLSEVATRNPSEEVLDKTGQILQGLISAKVIPSSALKSIKPSLGKIKDQTQLLSMIYKRL